MQRDTLRTATAWVGNSLNVFLVWVTTHFLAIASTAGANRFVTDVGHESRRILFGWDFVVAAGLGVAIVLVRWRLTADVRRSGGLLAAIGGFATGLFLAIVMVYLREESVLGVFSGDLFSRSGASFALVSRAITAAAIIAILLALKAALWLILDVRRQAGTGEA